MNLYTVKGKLTIHAFVDNLKVYESAMHIHSASAIVH